MAEVVNRPGLQLAKSMVDASPKVNAFVVKCSRYCCPSRIYWDAEAKINAIKQVRDTWFQVAVSEGSSGRVETVIVCPTCYARRDNLAIDQNGNVVIVARYDQVITLELIFSVAAGTSMDAGDRVMREAQKLVKWINDLPDSSTGVETSVLNHTTKPISERR